MYAALRLFQESMKLALKIACPQILKAIGIMIRLEEIGNPRRRKSHKTSRTQ